MLFLGPNSGNWSSVFSSMLRRTGIMGCLAGRTNGFGEMISISSIISSAQSKFSGFSTSTKCTLTATLAILMDAMLDVID